MIIQSGTLKKKNVYVIDYIVKADFLTQQIC